MTNNKHYQEIVSMISRLAYSRDMWEIFCDFMEMSAICVSNTVDKKYFDVREEQYLKTIRKYTPEHQKLFPQMFGELVLALECEYQGGSFVDVLGNLFHGLELHNKYRGQFFTPQHTCTMMGKITLGDSDKTVQEIGYIPVLEPACGSGAMVLGFAQAMRDSGYNHSQQMLVTGIDIDLKCVHMAYLQLSLYGIPAIIVHGTTLSLEEWSRWYTPAYIFGGWDWRSRRYAKQAETPCGDEQPKVILPMPHEAVRACDESDQLSLFADGGEI